MSGNSFSEAQLWIIATSSRWNREKGPATYVAEVDVETIFTEDGCSPYRSVEEPVIIYGEDAHSATVEDIFRGGYTAAKTPAL